MSGDEGFAFHPFLNACLNLTSAVLLVTGYRAVKRGDRQRHKRFMLSALAVSTAFLISYVIRFATSGTTPFPGEGAAKVFYLVILFSHMLLAMVVPVLAVGAVYFALVRQDFVRHRRWAKPAFPMWVYVSVTGVLVYWMLWHWPKG